MKQEIRNQFSEVFKSVNQSTGSLFSKTDVMLLLENLEEKILQVEASYMKFEIAEKPETNVNDLIEDLRCVLEEQAYEIADRINKDNIVDIDSAEFELNGNQIELTSIDLDLSNVEREICTGMNKIIDGYIKSL
jgi:hypothetical protein